MTNQIHVRKTGSIWFRGYIITKNGEGYQLCGQTYKTLDGATDEVDAILARLDADLCPSCGYHETRCRMTPDCIEAHLNALGKEVA